MSTYLYIWQPSNEWDNNVYIQQVIITKYNLITIQKWSLNEIILKIFNILYNLTL